MREIFTEIYYNNTWSSKESVSGVGSELKTTLELRERLPKLFAGYGIKRLLDLGCGDFNWMKEIAPTLDYYLGVDVVEPVIAKNIEKYSTDKIKFKCEDISLFKTAETFNAVMIRDVLVHFSFIDIFKVFAHTLNSNIDYLLTTSFLAETSNRDIPTGSWRRLNFMLTPFNFPPPLETMVSYSEPYDVGSGILYDKTLSMWQIKDIKEW